MTSVQDLKIAFVGVSHWHVPLYLPAVKTDSLNVVGVSDENVSVAARVAEGLNCRSYSGAVELLDAEKPDFVFAFDRHDRLPALAKELIARRIPFSIEKPLGLDTNDVLAVQKAAQCAGVFCAIPFVWRYSDLIRDFRRKVRPEDVLHLSLKFVAGPQSRYIEPSPWMLKKETAGGGCMTNLGVHFIDMALLLTQSDTAEILGAAFHYSTGYDVEDYASTLVRLSSGATLALETGYAYPMDEAGKRDNRWNIVTKQGYYTLGAGFFETRLFGQPTTTLTMDTDSDVYYARFTSQTLREFVEGKQPGCGLEDMARTRRVLDDVIAAASPRA